MPNTHHIVGSGPHRVIVPHGWFGDSHSFAPIEGMLSGDDFTYAFISCGANARRAAAHFSVKSWHLARALRAQRSQNKAANPKSSQRP